MTTYFFVLIGMVIFFGVAQKYDCCEIDGATGEVMHSTVAKKYYIIGAFILIFVAGLRYYVGTDFGAYYNGFGRLAEDFGRSLVSIDEPGIRFIAFVLHIFTEEKAVFIFVCSFITLFLMLRTVYKYSSQLFLAGLLFVFLGCWHGSFNGVRQYLAATIIFSAYPYLKNKEYRKYILLVIIAFLFHKSALIMVMPIFWAHRRVDRKNIILLILFCIVVFSSYDIVYRVVGFLEDTEFDWSGDYLSNSVNILRTLVAAAPAVFYLFVCRGREKDADETFWINLLVIHAVAMVIGSRSAYIARVGIYTSPFCAIAIPELNKKIEVTNRKIVTIVMLTLFFVFWWYDLTNSDHLHNFMWIWERAN